MAWTSLVSFGMMVLSLFFEQARNTSWTLEHGRMKVYEQQLATNMHWTGVPKQLGHLWFGHFCIEAKCKYASRDVQRTMAEIDCW